MHFERLVIEAGKRTYALDLHRRLTVIAGVGHLEREGLITELIGGLSAGRSGVHLEIASDAGQRYAIFRPAGGRHRVVDIDHSADVTESFTTDQGLDVLRRAGIDPRSARRQLCVTPDDLATRSQLEGYVASLARLDQSRLWDVAEKVKDRERRLTETAQETGSDTEDAVAYAEIERRHQDFERAQEENERVRYLSFITGAGSALVGVAAAALYGFFWALPFLMLAVGATVASVLYWQRLEMARKAEEEALRAVGVTSYLTFQIHRVNGLIGNDHARRVMMQAAEEHRAAMAEWRVLVGDVPLEWAVEHRREIKEQAAQLRDAVGSNRSPMSPLPRSEDNRAELAHVLLERLQRLKTIGAGGESFPMLLDDALVDVEPSAKATLLELLMKASANQQVIYLTEDPDVASWARVETLTGQLAIVEPASDRAAEQANMPRRRRSANLAV